MNVDRQKLAVNGCEATFIDEINPDWICSVCHELLMNVHETLCGHLFCYKCICTWLDKNENCPVCRTKNSQLQINKARYVERQLQNLKLYCPSQCDSQIAVKELKSHLADHCMHRVVGCPICNEKIVLSQKETHYTNTSG
eukprot:890843_1